MPTTNPLWMIRAGERGRLAKYFLEARIVAVGWDDVGRVILPITYDTLLQTVSEAYQSESKGYHHSVTRQLLSFATRIDNADIITYDNDERIYYIGRISGTYNFDSNAIEYKHTRAVVWSSYVKRDDLSQTTRNSLGAFNTIFQVSEDATSEIFENMKSLSNLQNQTQEEETFEVLDTEGNTIPRSVVESIIRDEASKLLAESTSRSPKVIDESRVYISDQISDLKPEAFQSLVAGVLRALGYKTKVTFKKDRGRDIVATIDGVGLSGPTILVEVKHVKDKIGPKEIRAFAGVPRDTHKAMFVSSGGFTETAKYEAERANVAIILIDRDDLIDLIIEVYDNFDQEAQAILPLTKVYFPTNLP